MSNDLASIVNTVNLYAIAVDSHRYAMFDATQHMTFGHAVALHGDEANCLSYVSGHFRRAIDGLPCVFESNGWYDDRLIRMADGWH